VTPYPDPPPGLVVDHDGAVLRLRLDRPDRRNALTDEMVLALADCLDVAGGDEAVRVIVLSGTGEHFSSGFDLARRAGGGEHAPRAGSIQRRMRWQVNRLVPTMLEVQTPIVAVVRGWAIGLGLSLVLAADFAVAADDARLWAPFTSFGFTPDSGSSWLLPRLAGVARAKTMLLLGRRVSGREAADWGLVHAAVPGADLDREAADLVGALGAAPTVAVGLTKLLVHRGLTADLHRHVAEEAFALEVAARSEDFAEHRRARAEGREPRFGGR
jgi:2-(1,2-epoxy-1,2-dihydrophenyl)acetyl-CoA isomerase